MGPVLLNGDPARTRTWNPLLRRQMLYPVELRDRLKYLTKTKQKRKPLFNARPQKEYI